MAGRKFVNFEFLVWLKSLKSTSSRIALKFKNKSDNRLDLMSKYKIVVHKVQISSFQVLETNSIHRHRVEN